MGYYICSACKDHIDSPEEHMKHHTGLTGVDFTFYRSKEEYENTNKGWNYD